MAYKGYENAKQKIRTSYNTAKKLYIEVTDIPKKFYKLNETHFTYEQFTLLETDWFLVVQTIPLEITIPIKLKEVFIPKVKITSIIKTLPEWEDTSRYLNGAKFFTLDTKIIRKQFDDNTVGFYDYEISASLYLTISAGSPTFERLPIYLKLIVTILNDRYDYELRKQKT